MTGSIEALQSLTAEALRSEREAEAERELSVWLAANGPVPRVMHWRALLLRALDRHAEALDLLHDATKREPDDPEIARCLAQIALEAGLPADQLHERALQLDPVSSATRLALVSAYFAAGRGDQGLALLDAALANNPGWIKGHEQFAQLATLTGQGDRRVATLARAIERFPDVLDLRVQALKILLMAGQYGEAADLAAQSIEQLGEVPVLLVDHAAALDELGKADRASALFERAGNATEVGHACWLLRHHLRRADPKAALAVAEPWLASEHATQIWPYVSLAWRLLGDRHAEWLEAQQGLVGSVDFGPDQIDLAALGACLRRIHAGAGRFVDQSVRGGTQTDGPLFSRIEPEIVAARRLISAAMARHIEALPAHDDRHPQLALPRDRTVRFSGSWSVRLVDQGFHTSHHHPMGWFSAVIYVAVPDTLAGPEGQLALGAPPTELGLGLDPYCQFVPVPGRLVIFPSTMWHGTLPFSKGERMTIAFDIARPFVGDVT